MKDPQEVERLANENMAKLRLDYPMVVSGSLRGTTKGVVQHVMDSQTVSREEDDVSEMLDDLTHVAIGELENKFSMDTMSLANSIASGRIDTHGTLSRSILGDTSEVLAVKMI